MTDELKKGKVTAYLYDAEGYYIGEEVCDVVRNTPIIPLNATLVEVLEEKEGHKRIFSTSKLQWVYEPTE